MNSGYLKLQRNLLSQPGIIDMFSAEGATGLGLYVAINLYLSHCEGGWGVYTSTQMSVLAVEGHRHRSDVKRVIDNYGLFVVDDKEKRFTSHWMQQQFGKAARKMKQSCGTPARTYYPHAEEIEIEIKKEKTEKGTKVPDMIGPSAYETVTRAGLRQGAHGEPVPWWAPPQCDVYMVWSLTADAWVPPNDIDAKAERQRYHKMNHKDFMMKTAWEQLTEQEQARIQDNAKRL
jgi:hypothetical protein